jgi:hypothetical protein
MNGKPVREIPLVPRRSDDDDDDDDADGCVCDVEVPVGEQTADEELPEALVPGLDRSPRAPKAKQ